MLKEYRRPIKRVELPTLMIYPQFFVFFLVILVLESIYDFNPPITITLVIMMLLFIMPIDFLITNWALVPVLSSVRIYSNGLERKRNVFEALRKQPSFIDRNMIDEALFLPVQGPDAGNHYSLRIVLKDGKKVRMPSFGGEQRKEIEGFFVSRMGIKVRYGDHKGQRNVMNGHEVRAPSRGNPNFCVSCGHRRESGEMFCTKCGKKLG